MQDATSTFKGSIVEDWLINEFYPTLNNRTTIVTTAPYCNQGTKTMSDKRTTCDPNSIVYSKVGLLTMDEYNILGADKSFLNTGDQFYTMTITGGRNVWVIDYLGMGKTGYRVNESTFAIRPVITVANDIKIRSGKGTATDPYRLENDYSATIGTKLNTRNSGEYVTFANQTWRIVRAGTDTKLVMDSLYKVNGDEQKVMFETIGNFNLTSGIGNYLNDKVYNDLFKEAEQNAMTKLSLYNAPYHYGADPRKTSMISTGTRIEAYVGLNTVGEILSGNWDSPKVNGESSRLKIKGITAWLMNYNDTYNGSEEGPRAWYTSTAGSTGFAQATDIRGVKPVIALRNYVTIKSGSGTSTDPYVLNY